MDFLLLLLDLTASVKRSIMRHLALLHLVAQVRLQIANLVDIDARFQREFQGTLLTLVQFDLGHLASEEFSVEVILRLHEGLSCGLGRSGSSCRCFTLFLACCRHGCVYHRRDCVFSIVFGVNDLVFLGFFLFNSFKASHVDIEAILATHLVLLGVEVGPELAVKQPASRVVLHDMLGGTHLSRCTATCLPALFGGKNLEECRGGVLG
mmetsp:Transcript_4019/g.5110  ORF Transcript_4019/g.5110 Transcript_4019/m.5110 type:complete len:208 (-) Transcript_4019:1523-2146(-)